MTYVEVFNKIPYFHQVEFLGKDSCWECQLVFRQKLTSFLALLIC